METIFIYQTLINNFTVYGMYNSYVLGKTDDNDGDY